jgi:flagellar hook-length control protein FliK
LLQLQQLAALTQNDEPAANQVSGLDEQFQEALNALSQTGAANLPAAHERKTAKAANDTQPAQWNDKSASVAPVQQTPAAAPVVTANARNTAATLRDPVWRFTVDPAANAQASADAATGSNAEPAPAASTTAPAWTLSSLVPNTDNNPTAQAQLPAQVPVQQFAEQMEKFLVKQFALTHGNGTAEAKLTLHPDHLGQVDVRIVLQNGQLTAQFMTENGMARDLLENQMSQLRSALQGQGLQVDRMEVVQQPTSSYTMSFLQQQDQQRQSNSGGGNSSSGQSRGGLYDDAEFETELAGTSLIPQIGYGSSINVTA